jgi:hypothetical protein
MRKTKLWLALGATLFSASLATHSFASDGSLPALGDLGDALSQFASGTTVELDAGVYTVSDSTQFSRNVLKMRGADLDSQGNPTTIIDGSARNSRMLYQPSGSSVEWENIHFQNIGKGTEGGSLLLIRTDFSVGFQNG